VRTRQRSRRIACLRCRPVIASNLSKIAAPILSSGPDVPLRHYRHQLIPCCHADPLHARPRRTPAGSKLREATDQHLGNPGLRLIGVLEEMQSSHPDHDWDRLRRSLERRVRAWRAEHGADREVIFRQDHVPGQHALRISPTRPGAGVSIAGPTLNHRLYHFVLAFSAWSMPRRYSAARVPPWPTERTLVARRGARRTSFRQPLRRVPQSR
jgi:hypothetical protein